MNRDRGSNVRRLRRHNAHRVPASGVSSWMEPLAPHEQRSTVNSPAEGDDDEMSVESFTALAQTSNRVVANERRDDDVNE